MHGQEVKTEPDSRVARRRIRIPALTHLADVMAIERGLRRIPGFREVAADITKQRVTVSYDVRLANFQDIVDTMEKTGFPPLDNWWSRRLTGWYGFIDRYARKTT